MKRSLDPNRCREILGVRPGATPEELKRVYHDLVKVWHPDRFPGDAGLQARAQERLQEINQAYEVLRSAPDARATPSPIYPPAPGGDHRPSATDIADERFRRAFTWVLLALFAAVLLSFTFYLYGKPQQAPDTTLQSIA